MIETKLFEVRDRMTLIPVMACRMGAGSGEAVQNDKEAWLLRRAGFSPSCPATYLIWLEEAKANYDPFAWTSGGRTLKSVHQYIDSHWNSLSSGQVIDVEFFSGETSEPKESEAR